MQAPVCGLQVLYLAQPWLTLNQALVWCCGMWPKRQSPLTAAPCTAAAQSTLVLLCVDSRNCTVHSCCCRTGYGLSKPSHEMHMVCNGHNAQYLAQLLLAAVCIGVPKLLPSTQQLPARGLTPKPIPLLAPTTTASPFPEAPKLPIAATQMDKTVAGIQGYSSSSTASLNTIQSTYRASICR